jgi:hypothetical protein
MDDRRFFHFVTENRREPHIRKLIDYLVTGKEGVIHFDGYYYEKDDDFPIRLFMYTCLKDEIPHVEKYQPDGSTISYYKHLEDDFYEIEFYRREYIEETNKYSEIEDEYGASMTVCFFPTSEQKLYFKIIQKFESDANFFNCISERFDKNK